MMSSFRGFFVRYWNSILLTIIMLGYLGWLTFYRLSSLTPSFTSAESSVSSQALSLRQILNNCVNGPYKLLQFLVQRYTANTIFFDRLISVLIGLLIILVFYVILRSRYRYYVAFFGTALFGSSTWFLHVTRLGTPEILLMSVMILIWVGLHLHKTKHPELSVFFSVIICGLILYVPGMVWFLAFGFIWQQGYLTRVLDDLPAWFRVFIILLAVALVAPIGYAAAHNPRILESFAAIPGHISSPTQYLRNLLEVPVNIFFRGPSNPSIWLGRLPLLDVFTTAMVVLGIYVGYLHRKLEFNRLLLGSIILATVLITINAGVTITVLVPLIYLVASGGIAELIGQWLSVFPRNPLAKSIGIGLLTLAIITAAYYQTTRYFVAWPHSTNTAIITQQPTDS